MSDALINNVVHSIRKKLSAPAAASRSRRKRSISEPSRLWTPGQTLRISFVDPTEDDVKKAIFAAASEWLEYANLQFERVDDEDATAEIRISTNGPENASFSLQGTQSMQQEGASMLIGCPPGHDLFEHTVLHEFGHALGLHHEHQHPEANIPWDLEALRSLIRGILADEGVPDEEIEDKMEAELADNFLPMPQENLKVLPYDPESIMHYEVLQTHTLGDYETGLNLRLSEKDKQAARTLYPGR